MFQSRSPPRAQYAAPHPHRTRTAEGAQVALGPLINERQRDRVHAIVQDAVREGAKLEAGGTYDRLFYKPTVLSAVRPTMRAFREEVFGPVANIITFASDDETVALANEAPAYPF